MSQCNSPKGPCWKRAWQVQWFHFHYFIQTRKRPNFEIDCVHHSDSSSVLKAKTVPKWFYLINIAHFLKIKLASCLLCYTEENMIEWQVSTETANFTRPCQVYHMYSSIYTTITHLSYNRKPCTYVWLQQDYWNRNCILFGHPYWSSMCVQIKFKDTLIDVVIIFHFSIFRYECI